MCQPRKWWPGLIPLALLWLVAIWWKTVPVENAVRARATAALPAQALDNPAITVRGRDVRLDGAAYTQEGRETAVASVAGARGVRVVRDSTGLIPEAKPYVWSAARDAAGLALSGSVPTPQARAAIADAARKAMGAVPVADNMNYARGAPAELAAAASFALAELSKLAKGEAKFTDSKLSLSGEAPDSAGYDRVLADLKAPPAGVTLGAVEILAPNMSPYIWSASRTATGIAMSGAVPSPDVRRAIGEAAQKAAAGPVEDRLAWARGAPPNFAAAAGLALSTLGALSSGDAKITDRALDIAGDAPTSAAYEQIVTALKSPPSGVSIGQVDIRPPQVRDFIWSAARIGDAITLTGNVPSADLRDALLAAARSAMPASSVTDQMVFARGAPAGFDQAALSALSQLGKLKDGIASFKGGTLSLSGSAPDAATRDMVASDLARDLPATITLASTVTAPAPPPPVAPAPKPFTATLGDGRLSLAGSYPDDKTHDAIVDAVKRKFSAVTLADSMDRNAGAPVDLQDGVVKALTQLARLASGTVSVSSGAVKISGEARYDKAIEQIKAALGQGAEVDLSVAKAEPVADAGACQALLTETGKSGRILFDTGKATIDEDSAATLDKVVASALRCPSGTITVAGYTDSQGNAEQNKALSQSRAKAVLDYMVKGGMEEARLKAEGFGADNPVASNDTPEGRAQNRRIEFTVQGAQP